MENSYTNPNKEVVLDLKYKISLEEYIYYNMLYAHEAFKKKKKKTIILGSLELITGLAIILTVFLLKVNSQEMIYILASLLVGLGIYSISFYTLIFPKSLKKSATEQYNKYPYFQNDINMLFYNNHFEEIAGDITNNYKWHQIESFAKSEKLFFITIENKRSILIPISSLGDDKYLLDELFNTLSQKYKKPYKLWCEK